MLLHNLPFTFPRFTAHERARTDKRNRNPRLCSCAKGLRYGHAPVKFCVLFLFTNSVALLGVKLEQPVLLGVSV